MNLSKSEKNNFVIRFVNCSLAYNAKEIFTNVNLDIFRGEKLAIIGKNGSGKTSLVESIVNPNKHLQGKIESDPNLHFSFVFQDLEYSGPIIALIEQFTYLMGVKNNINDWLKFFNLEKIKTQPYDYLSGGEKQIIKFLIAFLKKPDVIIIDEMTTSLDYITRLKVVNHVKNILKRFPDITLIMISHDEHEIAELCDQYVILADQKISEKKRFNTQDKINHVVNILDSI